MSDLEKFGAKGEVRCHDPATGELIEEVAGATPDDVGRAVERARKAFDRWSATSFAERRAAIQAAKLRYLDRMPQMGETLRRENGRPLTECYLSELTPSIALFDYYAKEAERLLAPERVGLSSIDFPGKSGRIEHVPIGVVGLIAPWNYPISISLRTIVPALMAGDCVVFKPSEYAALAGREVQRLFDGLLPDGVLEVVQGGGAVGAALVRDGIDRICFTGSVATGRRVAVAAAERLIPCSLELGGKDAAIVLHDADLERAANGIVWAAFGNAGQNCAAVERVYVVEPVAERFEALVVERAKKVRLRDDKAPGGGEVGPLTTPRQLEIVDEHVQDAVAKGAKLLVGGKRRPPGLFFEPTVLAGATHQMKVMTEETFGPVLPIARAKDEAEAVRLADDSRYGLTVSVWTADEDRADRLARRVRTGVATVNNHAFTAVLPNAPWGGPKETGGGVTNSRLALHELTRPHFVLHDRNRVKGEVWWYPYTETLAKIAEGARRMAYPGIGAKLGGVARLLPLVGRRNKEVASS